MSYTLVDTGERGRCRASFHEADILNIPPRDRILPTVIDGYYLVPAGKPTHAEPRWTLTTIAEVPNGWADLVEMVDAGNPLTAARCETVARMARAVLAEVIG